MSRKHPQTLSASKGQCRGVWDLGFWGSTWRVFRGLGLSKWVASRLISTLKGTLIGVMVLISP